MQRIERGGPGRRSIERHHHHAIGDDEIEMRGRRDPAKRVAIETDAGDADHLELAAFRVGRLFERARDPLQGLGVGVVGAGRRLADNAGRPDEAHDIVDMPIGVIVLEAFVDPDHRLGAERPVKCCFGFSLRPAVAIGVEQGLAGGKHGALAVMIDGAAFQNKFEAQNRPTSEAGDVVADRRVVGQIELAAPAVGLEPESDRAVVSLREDRASVAEPDIAVARRNEVCGTAERGTSGGFSLGAIDQQPHAVSVRKRAHHGGNVAPRRFQIAVPGGGIGRPGGPDRLLRRPFRGERNRPVGHGDCHVAPFMGRRLGQSSGKRRNNGGLPARPRAWSAAKP